MKRLKLDSLDLQVSLDRYRIRMDCCPPRPATSCAPRCAGNGDGVICSATAQRVTAQLAKTVCAARIQDEKWVTGTDSGSTVGAAERI